MNQEELDSLLAKVDKRVEGKELTPEQQNAVDEVKRRLIGRLNNGTNS